MAAFSHARSSKLCGELQCHGTWPHATPRGHELSAIWRSRGRLGLMSEFLIRCSVPNRAARLRRCVGFYRLLNQCTGSMYSHLLVFESDYHLDRTISTSGVGSHLSILSTSAQELFETAYVLGMYAMGVDGQRLCGDDGCRSLQNRITAQGAQVPTSTI